MLQHSAMLKSKALLLEKEALGCFAAFLEGTKTSGLWDILEKIYLWSALNAKRKKVHPLKRYIRIASYDPFKSTPATVPSSKIAVPINEGSLHDLGISLIFTYS